MIEINGVLLNISFAVPVQTEHCTCCFEQHVITHTCWNPVILGLERLQQLAGRIGILWCTVWLWQGCMQRAIYSWGQKSVSKTRAGSAEHSADTGWRRKVLHFDSLPGLQCFAEMLLSCLVASIAC